MASLAPAVLSKFHDELPHRGNASGPSSRTGNLIGEHTDYNLGLVLPMAIDLACYVATAPSNDGWLRVHSEQMNETSEWPLSAIPSATPRHHWSDRVAGIAWEILRRGGTIEAQRVLIDSTVPLGGGLSSSAAFGVSLALAFGGPGVSGDLATIARAAETDFVRRALRHYGSIRLGERSRRRGAAARLPIARLAPGATSA